MKSFVFSALSLLSLSALAEGSQTMKPAKGQPCQANLKNPVSLYETYDNDGVNLGARADILYMVYNVPVLTYASRQENVGTVRDSTILPVPGKMSLGCDVALLYTMSDNPGYSFELGWYHIVAKFGSSTNAGKLELAHSVAISLPQPGSASVSAQVAINFIDLLMKKDFAFGNWVFMTPMAGLIGGYVDGKNTAHSVATSGDFGLSPANTSTAATLAYTTKFEGIGIKIGGCSAFKIWDGFRLKADLSYSVLYGLSKAHLDYSQNGLYAGLLSGADVHFTNHHCRDFFDSLLALAWETRFCDDSCYLDLHVGWRFQTFSSGWKEFEAEFDDAMHELALQGQGLQAGLTFKF